MRPGPRNLITDVDGIRVGNAADTRVRTGVTVILPDAPAVAAVDVRGGAPGTRETDALNPSCLVDRADAVVLSGGSAFGLEAASAAASWLAARGRGYAVGPVRVPIVPAAILFDLLNGGDKDWGEHPPFPDLARSALETVSLEFSLGNTGAGFGAKAGTIKGGLGSASLVTDDGFQIGALIAANPFGFATMPGQPTLWAWALELDGEMGGQPLPTAPIPPDPGLPEHSIARAAANTTIGVVAVNADLTKAEALRLATMAHDGLARAIRPAHTPFDGDTLYVLATGTRPLPEPRAYHLARLGSHAADATARAIGRGIYHAEGLGPFPGYRELHGATLQRP
ncbi:P1 family peptidase [Azospirillum sp. sgz301742]